MLKKAADMTGHSPWVQAWMDYFESHDLGQLDKLGAAGKTLSNEQFRYVRVFDCGQRAVLEFETEMDGKYVNGVDMIEWDADGKITEFKVMVRPLQAMQTVHAAMGAMLAKMKN